MDTLRRTRLRRWSVFVAVVLAVVPVIAHAEHRSIAATVNRVVELCHSAGPWVYFAAMAILPVFGFSLFAFVASAGPLFVPSLGAAAVIASGVAALTVNVTLSYLLARRALRPLAERLIRHFGCVTPDFGRYGPWDVALLMRLLPGPPFGLQSCILGVAGIPFGVYLVTSIAVPALYFSGMVCVSSGAAAHNPWLACGAGFCLIGVCCAAHRLRRRLAAESSANAGQSEAV
jgi:uncharacterized membrane protein YdjX (TVP38/TMEM64 family)